VSTAKSGTMNLRQRHTKPIAGSEATASLNGWVLISFYGFCLVIHCLIVELFVFVLSFSCLFLLLCSFLLILSPRGFVCHHYYQLRCNHSQQRSRIVYDSMRV
jgi:hypothetical protein